MDDEKAGEEAGDGGPVDGAADDLSTDEVQGPSAAVDGEGGGGDDEAGVTGSSLPPPLPDRAEDDELERRIRDFTRESAQETLRLCGDLLGKKPERALNLLELYVHASRKLLVELAEPEDDLHRTADRMPRLRRPRVEIDENVGWAGQVAARRVTNDALLVEAQEAMLRRGGGEDPLLPLARTYASGLRMVLARASALGPEVLGPMVDAVKQDLGEELAEELLGVFAPVKIGREGPLLSPEEAAADLPESEQGPFEALVEEQDLEFVPQIPADLDLGAGPSFEEVVDGGFRLGVADAVLDEADEAEIDRALAEDDEEEAADEDEAEDSDEEALRGLGLGHVGGNREVLRLLRRQVALQRRIARRNFAVENPQIHNPYLAMAEAEEIVHRRR